MPQQRFLVEGPLTADQELTLTGERAHYLGRVLRLKVGAQLTVFADGGDDYAATVTAMRKQRVDLRLGTATPKRRESPLNCRLLQGIARGERMDLAVQKATELGVTSIQPLHTAFSVVKLSPDRAERRRSHWQKIARSACEQCGRSAVPVIELPITLEAALASAGAAENRLLLSPTGTRRFSDLPEQLLSVDLLVGPEGGLSAGEQAHCSESGFVDVTLGPRILRTETAAMAAVALAQSLWGDLQLPIQD